MKWGQVEEIVMNVSQGKFDDMDIAASRDTSTSQARSIPNPVPLSTTMSIPHNNITYMGIHNNKTRAAQKLSKTSSRSQPALLS
ncbi:hypothetical protein N7474_003199 [Penicillium riverlandense]|uniref:uncharacterized protein n=1 Tax=Penicillium riverlandense TaxID=1903569 RepID=UPI0025490F78|nr:uncharacterized protein N7474_003199 [Penicillium riverlandense]KAJ5826061.1 hypothetical protein N7474_003199 [Penicillium riverlandense]